VIIPIFGTKYYTFIEPTIHEIVTLHKEKDNPFDKFAIAVYNCKNEKIGYVSKKAIENKKVYSIIKDDIYYGRIWGIFPNYLLVELDLSNNPPPKK